jgi:Cytochrome P460
MKLLKPLSFIFALALSSGLALYLSQPASSLPVIEKPADGDFIAGYKNWTRVNSEPQIVPSRLAIQCAMPTAAQLSLEEQNPHRDKFVVVYVNSIGRAAMMEQKWPRFPQGSIIVKEKLSTKESATPELLTVMKKRESGYDPNKGDWEYFVFDGTGREMKASGKLEKCQGCHLEDERTDFVSRRYIPYDTWQKMK